MTAVGIMCEDPPAAFPAPTSNSEVSSLEGGVKVMERFTLLLQIIGCITSHSVSSSVQCFLVKALLRVEESFVLVKYEGKNIIFGINVI